MADLTPDVLIRIGADIGDWHNQIEKVASDINKLKGIVATLDTQTVNNLTKLSRAHVNFAKAEEIKASAALKAARQTAAAEKLSAEAAQKTANAELTLARAAEKRASAAQKAAKSTEIADNMAANTKKQLAQAEYNLAKAGEVKAKAARQAAAAEKLSAEATQKTASAELALAKAIEKRASAAEKAAKSTKVADNMAANTKKQLAQAEYHLAKAEETRLSAQLKQMKINDKLTKSNQQAASSLGKLSQAIKEGFGSISSIVKWAVGWQMAYGTLNLIKQGVSSAIENIVKFDYQLVQLQRVMGETETATKALASSLIDLANKYAINQEKVIEIGIEWAKQGKTVLEIQRLTEATLLATTAAFLTEEQAVDFLTSTLNTFGFSVDYATTLVDKLNNVSKSYAIDSGELADALKRVSSVARDMSVSFEELMGMITAVKESTTLPAEVIGTAMRTILVRIRQPEAVNALREIGIESVKASGEFVSFIEILAQLHKKWDTLSDVQREHIKVQIAGVRQSNILMALLQQFPLVLDSIATAFNSTGSASNDALKTLGSLQKQLDSISQQWKAFWTKDITENSGVLRKFLGNFLWGWNQIAIWLSKSSKEAKKFNSELMQTIRMRRELGQFPLPGGFQSYEPFPGQIESMLEKTKEDAKRYGHGQVGILAGMPSIANMFEKPVLRMIDTLAEIIIRIEQAQGAIKDFGEEAAKAGERFNSQITELKSLRQLVNDYNAAIESGAKSDEIFGTLSEKLKRLKIDFEITNGQIVDTNKLNAILAKKTDEVTDAYKRETKEIEANMNAMKRAADLMITQIKAQLKIIGEELKKGINNGTLTREQKERLTNMMAILWSIENGLEGIKNATLDLTVSQDQAARSTGALDAECQKLVNDTWNAYKAQLAVQGAIGGANAEMLAAKAAADVFASGLARIAASAINAGLSVQQVIAIIREMRAEIPAPAAQQLGQKERKVSHGGGGRVRRPKNWALIAELYEKYIEQEIAREKKELEARGDIWWNKETIKEYIDNYFKPRMKKKFVEEVLSKIGENLIAPEILAFILGKDVSQQFRPASKKEEDVANKLKQELLRETFFSVLDERKKEENRKLAEQYEERLKIYRDYIKEEEEIARHEKETLEEIWEGETNVFLKNYETRRAEIEEKIKWIENEIGPTLKSLEEELKKELEKGLEKESKKGEEFLYPLILLSSKDFEAKLKELQLPPEKIEELIELKKEIAELNLEYNRIVADMVKATQDGFREMRKEVMNNFAEPLTNWLTDYSQQWADTLHSIGASIQTSQIKAAFESALKLEEKLFGGGGFFGTLAVGLMPPEERVKKILIDAHTEGGKIVANEIIAAFKKAGFLIAEEAGKAEGTSGTEGGVVSKLTDKFPLLGRLIGNDLVKSIGSQGLATLTGAILAYQGGGAGMAIQNALPGIGGIVGTLLGGISGTMIGQSVGLLASMVFRGLFKGLDKKKTTKTVEHKKEEEIVSSKLDLTNQKLDIANRHLAAIKESLTPYARPESYYFREKLGTGLQHQTLTITFKSESGIDMGAIMIGAGQGLTIQTIRGEI